MPALCPFSNFVVRKRTAQLERLDFARITGSYSGPKVGFEEITIDSPPSPFLENG